MRALITSVLGSDRAPEDAGERAELERTLLSIDAGQRAFHRSAASRASRWRRSPRRTPCCRATSGARARRPSRRRRRARTCWPGPKARWRAGPRTSSSLETCGARSRHRPRPARCWSSWRRRGGGALHPQQLAAGMKFIQAQLEIENARRQVDAIRAPDLPAGSLRRRSRQPRRVLARDEPGDVPADGTLVRAHGVPSAYERRPLRTGARAPRRGHGVARRRRAAPAGVACGARRADREPGGGEHRPVPLRLGDHRHRADGERVRVLALRRELLPLVSRERRADQHRLRLRLARRAPRRLSRRPRVVEPDALPVRLLDAQLPPRARVEPGGRRGSRAGEGRHALQGLRHGRLAAGDARRDDRVRRLADRRRSDPAHRVRRARRPPPRPPPPPRRGRAPPPPPRRRRRRPPRRRPPGRRAATRGPARPPPPPAAAGRGGGPRVWGGAEPAPRPWGGGGRTRRSASRPRAGRRPSARPPRRRAAAGSGPAAPAASARTIRSPRAAGP